DPGSRADLALQHRPPVRGVLVPGGRRRRRGAERLGPLAGRPLDPADVADPPAGAVPELEGRPEARRLRAPLPALPRPRVRRARDARPGGVRVVVRAAARREPARAARARALLVGHPGLGPRAALPGDRLAGARDDGRGLGADGAAGPGRAVPP